MQQFTTALAGALVLAMSTMNHSAITSGTRQAFTLQPAALAVSQHSWTPESGDRLVIDTEQNEGYLIHQDGRFLRFPVITGQKRWVYYIGLTYNATTPTTDWTIGSRHIKGDRITYGPTGRFLRFYDKNGYTHYGVHEHAQEDDMFARDSLFQSMGCVIVRRKIMDILDETYTLNEAVSVKTQYGVEDPNVVAFK